MATGRPAVVEIICIGFAVVFGRAARQIGPPPMLGFLAAGFANATLGPALVHAGVATGLAALALARAVVFRLLDPCRA